MFDWLQAPPSVTFPAMTETAPSARARNEVIMVVEAKGLFGGERSVVGKTRD